MFIKMVVLSLLYFNVFSRSANQQGKPFNIFGDFTGPCQASGLGITALNYVFSIVSTYEYL